MLSTWVTGDNRKVRAERLVDAGHPDAPVVVCLRKGRREGALPPRPERTRLNHGMIAVLAEQERAA